MDSTHDLMIVFGGNTTSSLTNQTWVLAGADVQHGKPQWLALATAGNAPLANYSNGMYDPASNRFIVYGGVAGIDVWVFDERYRARLHTAHVAATRACRRHRTESEFLAEPGLQPDSQRYNGLRFERGRLHPLERQWNGRHAGVDAPERFRNRPFHAQRVYVHDTPSNRTIVFGGPAGGVDLNDYWVLTNANGFGDTPEWEQLKPGRSTMPAAREGHTAVYDSVDDAMTIFGGIGQPAETWTATHANGVSGSPVWKKVNSGASSIEQSTSCSAALDTRSLSMIIFGGYNTSMSNSTYVLSPVL